MSTTKINIDVKFKTPEAAALGFGLLYHAAGIVQSGCRRQLNDGMADEATADNFIAHALRDEQAREAAIGLAGRIMEDSLRSLADGLDLGEEAAPIALDREPAQIVRDGLVGLLAEQWVPSVETLRGWSTDLLESAAAWVMSVHEARRAGQPEPLLPRTLVVEIERGLPQPTVPEPTDEQMADLLRVPVDVVEASNARNLAANRRLASELGLEAVWRDGTLTFQPRAAGVDYLTDTGRMNARGELVRSAPPWAALDPGIVAVVRLLHEAGFKTCDSGDGRTKQNLIQAGYALPFAHVHATCTPTDLVSEAARMQQVLAASELEGWVVEASFSPKDGQAILTASQQVPSTVQAVTEGGDSKPLEFTGTFEPAALAQYTATGNERVRFVVDGVTMWASEVTIERFETPPTIGPDDFMECAYAIEFYADGEYNTTTVERLRLRIEVTQRSGAEGGTHTPWVDFTLYADGELHDGCSSLTEVGNSYPNVAPTIEAWKAGRTVPFAVVVTAARKLAGLTEPLPEESL